MRAAVQTVDVMSSEPENHARKHHCPQQHDDGGEWRRPDERVNVDRGIRPRTPCTRCVGARSESARAADAHRARPLLG